MPEALGELLALKRRLNTPTLAEYPDVEEARCLLQERIE